MFNQFNVDKINQQIQELERIKNGFQSMQQPITNVINTTPQQIDFEARYITKNDNVDEILVQRRTAFICLENNQLTIKEINGDTTTYELLKPKTPEQLKIEELERRLSEYEQQLITTNNEISKSTTNDNEHDELTTKRTSKSVSKQSE